jgi:hypothetical protein
MTVRQFFLGRQSFYGEIVLMVVLGAASVILAVTGVGGLVTGRGGGGVSELVLAGLGAFWCNMTWRDVQRQRRRFADPNFQGFQGHKN